MARRPILVQHVRLSRLNERDPLTADEHSGQSFLFQIFHKYQRDRLELQLEDGRRIIITLPPEQGEDDPRQLMVQIIRRRPGA
jgi:hypothetical protein